MKVFQVENGICFYDMTHMYDSAAHAAAHYPASLVIVDAPDEVREGWTYDGEKFSPPIMEGMVYDDSTGCFYAEGAEPPKPVDPSMEKQEQKRTISQLEDIIAAMLGEETEVQNGESA